MTAGAILLGLFNLAIAMLRAPFSGFGQFEDVVPVDALRGSRFVLVILGIMLVAIAPSLWHGKRMAWLVALGCAGGSAAAHLVKNVDLWGAVAAFTLFGTLLGARPEFPARSDPPTAIRGVWTLVLGILLVFAYSTLGLYFLDRDFKHPIPFIDALQDSMRLLFIVPATAAEPRTHHGLWFVDSVRMAFLFVMLLGVAQLLQPVVRRVYTSRVERERVRTLLERRGNSSIAYFALLPDKSYFFHTAGSAVLAYRLVGGNAIVMGDPIGDETAFPELLDQFQEHCELDGWAYAFHQATERYLDLYEQHGLKALKIGEEGIVPVQEFTLSGTAVKHLRATMNRFEREGYRVEVLAPPHDRSLLERLREISDDWLAQGNRRERTFTLGYFDESILQDCEIMLARGPDGEIAGFANIIPSYRLPQGNFDMLRYRAEPKAIADFLYVSLINYFREEGYQGMNLGLAPFSGLEDESGQSAAARAMRLLYRRGSFLFRYRGLREFKEKFGPVWEPRYLVYSGDLQLPGIALAVTRAGEMRGVRPAQPEREEEPASAADAA